MSQFRLLRAAGTFKLRNQRNAPEFGEPEKEILEVEFAPKVRNGSDSWTSIVIGRNGVGKSRLLAGIADVFDRLDRERKIGPSDSISVSLIEYICEERHVVLSLNERGVVSAKCDGKECMPWELPLPGKIIALTTTPFDKFRISHSERHSADPARRSEERYKYLGLRDRSGRASPVATIFRALEGLFQASKGSDERRLRIAHIFSFLGYEPRVEVRYRLRASMRGEIRQLVDGVPLDQIVYRNENDRPASGLRRFIEDPETIHLIRKVSEEIDARDGLNPFSLQVDFRGHSDDDLFFRDVQRLRRIGVLEMMAVEVQRQKDGAVLDLRHASSGELGIVTGFLGIASAIRDNSLIFIDEPEISLHPEWQTRYVDLLSETFVGFEGCHFVLATHSPLILSDIEPESSSVVSLDPDRRRAEKALAYSGKSYDYLLATAFEEPGPNNLFVKEEIIRALRLVADGKNKSPEFVELINWLTSVEANLRNDSPIVDLIKELRLAGTVEEANR